MMATGDDAVAAGMDIVPGTTLSNTIDTELNKTRDYIAQRTFPVLPISNGGTGATTAADARTALNVVETAGINAATPFKAPAYNNVGRLVSEHPGNVFDVATKGYVDSTLLTAVQHLTEQVDALTARLRAMEAKP